MTIGDLKKIITESGLPDGAEVMVEDQEYEGWAYATAKMKPVLDAAFLNAAFLGISIDYDRTPK